MSSPGPPPPRVGLVIGSGLASLVDHLQVEQEVTFSEAGVPEPSVPGHSGRFLFARLEGRPFLVAQGRVHLYEGHSPRQVAAGIRWMAAQGIRALILTNAAGSLRPDWSPGQWMILEDHINLTAASPLAGEPRFVDMTHVYDPAWRHAFQQAARARGIGLHSGVYACVPGPQYETPAEVRLLQRLGADAVGMSTVPEAIQARALGLPLAAFSCLTNPAAGLSPQPLSHHEVLQIGRSAASSLIPLLSTPPIPPPP